MDTQALETLLRETNGRFFSVTFTKRTTGEPRKMLARLGVQKGLTGAGARYDAKAHGLLTVYEVGVGWRSVPLDGVTQVRAGGKVYDLPVGE